MSDFTITERTEPFTLEEVFDFIDDTNIGEMDACELKSRIVDVIQAERNKAIDEFAKKLKEEIRNKYGSGQINHAYNAKEKTLKLIYEIAEQMKGGAE